ncbi:MAG: type II secretion system protein GspL [Deferrisomatales bacterium]|nr:type II secretion system protein GspL [Deferrisomatales bacterium]
MPKTVLGIRWGATCALGVYLKGGWKTSAVTRVARVDLPSGSPEERGAALLAAGLPSADTVVAALPADAAFARVVELPFADRARIVQAAPLEAEETLPLPLEELVCHVQVLGRKGGASTALLVAVPEEREAALLAGLAAAGRDPQIVDVEALALATVAGRALAEGARAVIVDLSPDLCQAVAVGASGPQAFHAFSSDPTDPGLLEEVTAIVARWAEAPEGPSDVYLSGPGAREQDLATWRAALACPVDLLPFPAAGLRDESGGGEPWPDWAVPLGLALRDAAGRQVSQLNLRQGPFAPTQHSAPWRHLAAVCGIGGGILVSLWGLGVWTESAHREAQYQTLRADIRETFRRTLPQVRTIVSEVDQMRTAVRELEARAQGLGSLVDRDVSPLRVLREISSRIPKELEVEFRDFTVEEGRVRIDGVTGSFDAIDRIKADLSQYPRFSTVTVSDAKAGVERDKVLFRLTINLGREG